MDRHKIAYQTAKMPRKPWGLLLETMHQAAHENVPMRQMALLGEVTFVVQA